MHDPLAPAEAQLAAMPLRAIEVERCRRSTQCLDVLCPGVSAAGLG